MSSESKHTETKDPRVEAAIREYLEEADRNEVVDLEEFIARHPEIADALRSFIAADVRLRKIAPTRIARESDGVSTRSFTAQGQETVPPKANPDRSTAMTGSGLQGQFGRYLIIRLLGSGAMGAVYLAKDTQLKRNVAIKTPHFEDDPTGELLKRFYREAEAAATLLHANICPVYDVGEIDGKHFISMAYIEGQPLSDLIRNDKAQSERQILIAVHKLARALQQAHDREIVHRDLKPANIMINRQGEPIIMDFGLARKRRAEGEASLTHSGVLMGSPAYMSPEQIEGDPDSVGPPSDQYSLGVVLYEMLTGQLPFRGSVVNVLAQILTRDLTRPSELRPGLDRRIEAVCLRMMSKKVSDRFSSMKTVAEELYAILKNPAAELIDAGTSPRATRRPVSRAPSQGEGSASQFQNSAKQTVLTETDVASLEELIRKCLRRHDYDQVIQIVERIPEERRSEGIQSHLATAREKADEIAFLICEIDEADRLEDGLTALKKAEELSKLKPGHHRAQAVQEKYSGYGDGRSARVGTSWRSTQRWDQGGWIPWTALVFGLAVIGVMTGVMYFYLRGTWIVVDVQDPDVKVAVKGSTLTITGPAKEDIKVDPGNQELAIAYGDLNFTTRTFTLKKGETKTVTISVVDRNVVVKLSGQALSLELQAKTGKPLSVVAATGEQELARTLSPKLLGNRLPSAGEPSRPTDTAPATASVPSVQSESDRRAAQAVLALGGFVTIRVQDQEQAISTGNPLPSESFQLLKVNLGDRSNLTDAGLEPLRSATHLVEICLNHTRVSDAGFMCFNDLSRLEVLCLEVVPVTDRAVSRLAGLTKLRVLDLGVTHVTDAGLAHLDGLVNLEFLNVGETGNGVTDAGLQHIGNLRRLKYLNLNGTQVTNAGLAYLEDLTQLEATGMSHTHVRGSGLVHLRKLVRLKNLWLDRLGVTDGDLAQLRGLTALEWLHLADTLVSGPGLVNLKAMKRLHILDLNNSRMTNSGLEYLKNLPQLQKLGLRGTKVTDAGLRHLEAMTNLAELDLTETRVTPAGVERLKAALPTCQMIFQQH
jgi:serine/threonine protein kinase